MKKRRKVKVEADEDYEEETPSLLILPKRKLRDTIKASVLRKGKLGSSESPPCDKQNSKRQRGTKTRADSRLEEDHNFPVAVETNIYNEQGDMLKERLQINLLSHCIFCLRNATNHRNTLSVNQDPNEMAPLAKLSKCSSTVLSTFNRTWWYLGEKVNKNVDEKDLFKKFTTHLGDTTFMELPKMCTNCAETLTEVDRLFRDLKAQLEVLQEIMKETKSGGKYSWRAEQLRWALEDSDLSGEIIEATINILALPNDENGDGEAESRRRRRTHSLSNSAETPTEPSKNKNKQVANLKAPAQSVSFKTETPLYSQNTLNEHDSDFADLPEDTHDSTDFFEADDIERNHGNDFIIKPEPVDELIEPSNDNDMEWSPSSPPINPKAKKRKQAISRPRQSKKITCKPKKKLKKKLSARGSSSSIHKCDECNKAFALYRSLQTHKIKIHQQDPMTLKARGPVQLCDLCRLQVPVTEMYEHLRAHVGEEYIIKCPNSRCPRVYSNSTSLHMHLRGTSIRFGVCRESVSSLKEFFAQANSCQVCGYRGKSIRDIRGHLLRTHETSIKNFACPIEGCPQKFTVKQSVSLHIPHHDMCLSLDVQRCAECISTVKLELMEKHLKEVHGAEEVVKCNRCPFLFSTRELLIEHLFEHRYGVLSCDICGEDVKFPRHIKLREHYFKVHGIGKEFVCEECGRISLTKHLADDHYKMKHGDNYSENKKKVQQRLTCNCDLCGEEFKGHFQLKDHKIREHGAEPYSCTLCSGTWTTYIQLKRHESEHRGEPIKKFKCEVKGCDRSFNQKVHLQSHIASRHRMERPHVCEICGKAYFGLNGLVTHTNAVHLGLRSHVCEICGESFSVSSTLRRHKLIHTGERPFACTICGQRFRHSEVLKRHVEGHERKGADFKPNGPMKQVRKRVEKILHD